MKTKVLILVVAGFLMSCSKENDSIDNNQLFKKKISSGSYQNIEISHGDTLRLNLGPFGDEEGAWISEEPKHAFYSNVYRAIDFSTIYYDYLTALQSGKDTVGLILNRGSDGASPGVNDSVYIYIQIN